MDNSIDHFSSDCITQGSINPLWRLELEIADVLLSFCERHNLRIFACYGTLLGAARHKGFIPWDDDIDFVMMRDDYDKLIDIIKSGTDELPKNYEFDYEDISVLKLRRSDTTGIIPFYRWSKDIKNGMWVDVFCLDVAPDNFDSVKEKYKSVKRRIRIYRNRRLGFYAFCHRARYVIGHFVCRFIFLFMNIGRFRKKTEDILREDAKNYSGKKVWGFMIWSILRSNDKIARMDSSWFDDVVMLPFEDRMLPCPIGWDDLLTAQYGDWHIPVRGGSQHEGSRIDIHRPYSEYIENTLREMPWWKRYWYKH